MTDITTDTTTDTAPLAETLRHLRQLSEYLQVELGEPSGDGWFAPETIFAEDGAYLETLREQVRTSRKSDDAAYLKVSVFANYLWLPVVTGIASYLIARRAPDLSAANLRVYLDPSGWAERLALRAPRFACLPHDRAARDPNAVVVPDDAALRAYYARTLLGEHLTPAAALFRSRLKLNRATTEKILADRIAGTVLWLSQQPPLNEHASADPRAHQNAMRHEVAGFLDATGLAGRSDILEIDHGGRCKLFLARQSCCLSYKLPDHGYCATCPLQGEEARVARLRGTMTKA